MTDPAAPDGNGTPRAEGAGDGADRAAGPGEDADGGGTGEGEAAAVRLDGVTKRYGGVAALDDVTLAVPPGGVHALAGPNGSGKTTVLRLLAGLVRPDAGSATRPDGRVGYGFQRPNVYPDLTVAENLDTFGRLLDADPGWREHVVDHLRLRRVTHRRAGDLSDGYRKKLDLALGVLGEPALLLLDEPLADLDDLTRERLVELVGEYAGPDRVVLLSTHHLDAFTPHLTGLSVLLDGRLVAAVDGGDLGPEPSAVAADAVARAAGETDRNGRDHPEGDRD